MKPIAVFVLTVLLLTSCNSLSKQEAEASTNDRIELVPEPDKGERLKYEAIQKLKKLDCAFVVPDTSLSGIAIRNSESATKIIGDKNQIDSIGEHYHFYTKFDRETLTLTKHPGDFKNQISIFKIEYSDKADHGYKQLPIDTLMTEKGIKLGLTKEEIIEKLGTCYAILDSSRDYIELYYRIELPNDSRTSLLARHHMPIYYASYKLWNHRLEKFEFGFEYP
jgi:hypothetical protein